MGGGPWGRLAALTCPSGVDEVVMPIMPESEVVRREGGCGVRWALGEALDEAEGDKFVPAVFDPSSEWSAGGGGAR